MEQEPGRITGWKSIAAHLGRDRKTVARWARSHGLPVYQIPGGKQMSVFAYRHELDDWTHQNAAIETLPDAAAPSDAAPSDDVSAPDAAPEDGRPARRSSWLAAAGGALAMAALWGATHVLSAPAGTALAFQLPTSPEVAQDYLNARNAWGRRTGPDILRSIALYEKVIERAPDFAPARAGLAEAWLISREYGDVADARAYGAARIAAGKAIALDPDLAAGHRALGFIQYWWDNEPDAARASFERAIALDPRDWQTQFWYANMLADIGDVDGAERYYRQAMLTTPGWRPIEVEHACASWQAGRDEEARRLLTELKQRYPDDATIRNCLTWLHIGRGDIVSFAEDLRAMARLRGEQRLVQLSADLDAALARDPATAHRVLIADARRELTAGSRRMREVPAFYASAMGDRAELLGLMREAQRLGEQWNSISIARRIQSRWAKDREITDLLRQLRAPKLPAGKKAAR